LPAQQREPAPTLFQAALADRWDALPPAVQRLHSVRGTESFTGRARVVRGRSPIARLAAWLLGFPRAGDDVPLRLTLTCLPHGEAWERSFDGRRLRSRLLPSPRRYCYRERFGAFTFEQALPVKDGVMRLRVRRGWLLGVPLPSLLLPRSCASECAVDGRFQFDIGIHLPVSGALVVRYQGSLAPEAPPIAAE
jgi:hypothetical protein